MIVHAPKDGFVKTILSRNGEQVANWQVILVMDDLDEQVETSKLMMLLKSIELLSNRGGPDQISAQQAFANLNWSSLDDTVGFRERMTQAAHDRYEVGEVRFTDLERQKAALADARAELEMFELERNQATKTNEHVDYALNETRKYINRQLVSLDRRIKRLSVKSPGSGRVHWFVFENGFISEGEALGEIL